MIRSIAIVTVTLSSIAALAMPTSALASDQKTFSPLVCVPNGPPSSEDSALSYSYLGLLNTSTTNNLVVTCPLSKDAEYDGVNNFGEVAFSYKIANDRQGTVNCTVQVGYLGTDFYSASSSETVQPAGTFESGVHLPVEWVSNTLPAVNLVCSLSPRARLVRMWMDENKATD